VAGLALCARVGSFDQTQAKGAAIGEDSGMKSTTATIVAQMAPQSVTVILSDLQPLQAPEPISEAMPAMLASGDATAMGMTRI